MDSSPLINESRAAAAKYSYIKRCVWQYSARKVIFMTDVNKKELKIRNKKITPENSFIYNSCHFQILFFKWIDSFG